MLREDGIPLGMDVKRSIQDHLLALFGAVGLSLSLSSFRTALDSIAIAAVSSTDMVLIQRQARLEAKSMVRILPGASFTS